MSTVNNSNPTGTTEKENFAMAVEVHMKKTAQMNYDYRGFDVSLWVNHLAYNVLKNEPKWAGKMNDDRRTGHLVLDRFVSETVTASNATNSHATGAHNNSVVKEQNVPTYGEFRSQRKGRGCGNLGRDKAKSARREEIETRAVMDLAISMRAKNELLEEINGVLAFTSNLECMTEADVAVQRECKGNTSVSCGKFISRKGKRERRN